MHEASLMIGVIDQVEVAAREYGFYKVMEVSLRVGKKSGVDPHAVEFCFSEMVRGSILEGAVLRMELSEGREFCVQDVEVL